MHLEIKLLGVKMEIGDCDLDDFSDHVDDICTKVGMLQQKMDEIDQFYSTRSPNALKSILKKQEQDVSHKEAAAAKRMQKLIRQFATILRHVIKGSIMDFSTIKNKMEAKDGTGYEHVRDIYADVRLLFKNAKKYNDEGTETRTMANAMLKKLEEKWKQQLLPKVIEEEKQQYAEGAGWQVEMQIAQEAGYTQMAEDIHTELNEVDKHLEELRETIIQKFRRISTDDKKKILSGLERLSAEDLNKAMEIVAQNNPSFVPAEKLVVNLDLDVQSESTLWKLKIFLSEALRAQKTTHSAGHSKANNRKRVIREPLSKTAEKGSKKVSL